MAAAPAIHANHGRNNNDRHETKEKGESKLVLNAEYVIHNKHKRPIVLKQLQFVDAEVARLQAPVDEKTPNLQYIPYKLGPPFRWIGLSTAVCAIAALRLLHGHSTYIMSTDRPQTMLKRINEMVQNDCKLVRYNQELIATDVARVIPLKPSDFSSKRCITFDHDATLLLDENFLDDVNKSLASHLALLVTNRCIRMIVYVKAKSEERGWEKDKDVV